MSASDQTTEVVIHTDLHAIRGRIELLPGARLTDFIRSMRENFIAVTDAEVRTISGEPLLRAQFLDVAVHHIRLIVPAACVSRI